MLVDTLLQHEVEGRVDRLIENAGGLENKWVELVDELTIKVAKEVAEVMERMKALTKSRTLLPSSLSNCKTYFLLSSPKNGCLYKDFVTCKLNVFDGKGCAVAYIRWVEKMEAVQDIGGCGDNKKVKYSAGSLTDRASTWWNFERLETGLWNHVMVRAGHSTYTNRFHKLVRLVATTKPLTIQSAILKARVLTDEAVRNGSLNRTGERRRDNESRGGSKMVNPLNAKNQTAARGACYEYGGTDYYNLACPRVYEERPKEKVKRLMSAKVEELKLEDIAIDQNFSEMAKSVTILTQKNKKYVWGNEQKVAFQTLKDKLCNAPALTLLNGLEDFVVYCDASCQGMGKENVIGDALSRKERINPRRVRAMNMTIQSIIKGKILAAQNEASEVVNAPTELLRGLDEQMYLRSDGALHYIDRIWVPLTGSGRDLIRVVVDRLTKSAHFQPIREYFKMDKLARLYINEIMARHEVGEGQLIGPEIVQETTEKISQIKDRLKAARDCQKSYADKHKKPLEFNVGDYVLLKVSPWKGMVRFRMKGKLALEPVEILEREIKKLKRSKIPVVKDRWNLKRGLEFTWEPHHKNTCNKSIPDLAYPLFTHMSYEQLVVKMDDPNITMKEYIRLEEEKTRRRVFNDMLTSDEVLSCEPIVSSLNDNKIDFRIPFDKSDDEDYTVIYDDNSFSFKIISINDFKTDLKNDNDNVNMASFPSPELEVKMDDPNIIMEEYIRLEEERACRHGKVYNWETAMYGKIWYDEDVYDLKSVVTEFPVIVFHDTLTPDEVLSCEPTVSPLNDNKINFRISFDESDDEDYTSIGLRFRPPRFSQSRRDLPRNTPLDRVEVLGSDDGITTSF
uniref:Reverse transcriptase/retrotransposon-derived protein RNase H-like domain-containing protein n=1 Tax=Tanacetum cinerariifolium TaxID=118510 RepID=A0A6L2KAP7_TANCI|nr:hypothetical protein [Tanacetum cinerariifolium]